MENGKCLEVTQNIFKIILFIENEQKMNCFCK